MRLAAFAPTWYIAFWLAMGLAFVLLNALLTGLAVYYSMKWGK